jgi:hypothetical protein
VQRAVFLRTFEGECIECATHWRQYQLPDDELDAAAPALETNHKLGLSY